MEKKLELSKNDKQKIKKEERRKKKSIRKDNFRIKMLSSAGSSFFNWFRLLWINKFKVEFKYIPRALMVTFTTILLYPFVLLEKILYDRKIKNTAVKQPVFIIGHMRSGTTFLHYLLSMDDRFTYASTTEVIFPWVFLLLHKPLTKFMETILPNKRPMDSMRLNTELPQEEELAIANLCIYSPYNGAYFPERMEEFYIKYSFMDNLDEKTIKRWKKTYKFFLQKIAFKDKGKQVLSKSIVNSCRIKILKEMFPDAKFIFIYRNPYKVFLSSKKLYKKFIFDNMSYQDIDEQELERVILKLADMGYRRYLRDRDLIDENNLIEIKFEDFVKDPINQLENLYKKLNLDNFEKAKPEIEKFAKSYENYKADKYEEDKEIKKRVYESLKIVYETFGYN